VTPSAGHASARTQGTRVDLAPRGEVDQAAGQCGEAATTTIAAWQPLLPLRQRILDIGRVPVNHGVEPAVHGHHARPVAARPKLVV
jgi:hypothetical protein